MMFLLYVQKANYQVVTGCHSYLYQSLVLSWVSGKIKAKAKAGSFLSLMPHLDFQRKKIKLIIVFIPP